MAVPAFIFEHGISPTDFSDCQNGGPCPIYAPPHKILIGEANFNDPFQRFVIDFANPNIRNG
ncbi:hypothetical protein DSCW_53540 [Desulfosarcina widdelii]|uniref:Uncharacterized protein n=1 Tax=Desulfosarcina widdelii TaxID=947919 RepID=A0A5K7ZNU9_9BACT|nr:hypothetical protein DSCW_53540 [Desulfosarcina widdelii]